MGKPYDIILADPPWQQTKGGLRSVRPQQFRVLYYSTLGLSDIEQHLHTFCGDNDNTLFLWAIDKYLHDAESMAERLGYKRHARLIWDKGNGVAPAFTVRFSHEYLLWMYRGKFNPVAENIRGKLTTVIRENSTKHSRKPIAAYELIEKLYPAEATRIELYARANRIGWEAWGNELPECAQPKDSSHAQR